MNKICRPAARGTRKRKRIIVEAVIDEHCTLAIPGVLAIDINPLCLNVMRGNFPAVIPAQGVPGALLHALRLDAAMQTQRTCLDKMDSSIAPPQCLASRIQVQYSGFVLPRKPSEYVWGSPATVSAMMPLQSRGRLQSYTQNCMSRKPAHRRVPEMTCPVAAALHYIPDRVEQAAVI